MNLLNKLVNIYIMTKQLTYWRCFIIDYAEKKQGTVFRLTNGSIYLTPWLFEVFKLCNFWCCSLAIEQKLWDKCFVIRLIEMFSTYLLHDAGKVMEIYRKFTRLFIVLYNQSVVVCRLQNLRSIQKVEQWFPYRLTNIDRCLNMSLSVLTRHKTIEFRTQTDFNSNVLTLNWILYDMKNEQNRSMWTQWFWFSSLWSFCFLFFFAKWSFQTLDEIKENI